MYIKDMYRVASCCPVVSVSNAAKNADVIIDMIKSTNANVMLFPELATTGYTCADLFATTDLIEASNSALLKIVDNVHNKLVVVGAPIEHNGALFNCAVVIKNQEILGIIPKTFLPNYREFYEKRWFASSVSTNDEFIYFNGAKIPFGTDLLFKFDSLVVGIEICEDVWSVIPPSSFQVLSGANLILNLSSSNELVGKADYRTNLVKHQSEKLICAYAYSSSGTGESTTDLVFGGHCMIYENGNKLSESNRFEINKNTVCISDIDINKISNERKKNPTFTDSKVYLNKKFRTTNYEMLPYVVDENLLRPKNPHPFVPSDSKTRDKNFNEIVNIQVCSIVKRIQQLKNKEVFIGISGGSDSTEAALALGVAYDRMDLERSLITGIMMRGFGTSNKTKNNSEEFIKVMGFKQKKVDIRQLCIQTWRDMNYCPFNKQTVLAPNGYHYPVESYIHRLSVIKNGLCSKLEDVPFGDYSPSDLTIETLEETLKLLPDGAQDLVFENVQARIRTMILMSHGFVIGTGDMSELALGWCTYNGDHMSMYNPNCSIPKTLVKELIRYYADNCLFLFKDIKPDRLKAVLQSIYETVVSPELLPLKDGEIAQSTEDSIGPYELHDFFLYNFIRNSFSFKKIAILAYNDFDGKYSYEEVKKWLKMFIERFFIAQFKRSCVPDGPKVGSVSLSPRGDWRMPSDADVKGWINEL